VRVTVLIKDYEEEDELVKVTRRIVEFFRKEKRQEFEGIECEVYERGKKVDRDNVVLVTSAGFKLPEQFSRFPIILVVEKLTTKALDITVNNNVFGIVFYEHILKGDPEEIGTYARLLKEAIRNVVLPQLREAEAYKHVNWKFTGEIRQSEVQRYISLFMDPSTRKLAEKIRKIVADLREKAHSEKSRFFELVSDYLRKSNIGGRGRGSKLRKLKDLRELFFSCRGDEEKAREKKVFEFLQKFKGFRFPPVLIMGPTGSGKSLIASYIALEFLKTFTDSKDEGELMELFRHIPLVNLEAKTVDVELFGAIPGSFTGSQFQLGAFVENIGGVVFLDEIGDATPDVQVKLLAYLDDNRVSMINYHSGNIYSPTLVIAATNRDLEHMVRSEEFRSDLYNRFVRRIHVPPLVERKKDMRFLISFLLTSEDVNPGGKVQKISLKAIEKLEEYSYPGNFREFERVLKNAVSAAKMAGRDIILERDVEFKD